MAKSDQRGVEGEAHVRVAAVYQFPYRVGYVVGAGGRAGGGICQSWSGFFPCEGDVGGMGNQPCPLRGGCHRGEEMV